MLTYLCICSMNDTKLTVHLNDSRLQHCVNTETTSPTLSRYLHNLGWIRLSLSGVFTVLGGMCCWVTDRQVVRNLISLPSPLRCYSSPSPLKISSSRHHLDSNSLIIKNERLLRRITSYLPCVACLILYGMVCRGRGCVGDICIVSKLVFLV